MTYCKTFKHGVLSLVTIFFGSNLAGCATFSEVSKTHGFSEAVDQCLHEAGGTALATYFRVRGETPCDSIKRTMEIAVKREFYQKSKDKQLSGDWCLEGCQRDLTYWLKGAGRSNSCAKDFNSYKEFLPSDMRDNYRVSPLESTLVNSANRGAGAGAPF